MPPFVSLVVLVVVVTATWSLVVQTQAVSVSLRPVAELATEGCSGFWYFEVDDIPFLAVANFWDGASKSMESKSRIYQVHLEEGLDGVMTLRVVQEMTTKGAHGVDVFRAPSRGRSHSRDYDAYLTIPNYYGCGTERGPAKNDCENTFIMRLTRGPLPSLGDESTSPQPKGSTLFKSFQKLSTSGPAQTTHIVTSHGDVYVVVGENFNREVCLYRLQSDTKVKYHHSAFVKHQCFDVHGAGSVAIMSAHGKVFLVAASYHNSKTGWSTRTAVFAAKDDEAAKGAKGLRFAHIQDLPTTGCHDADIAEIQGVRYLFLAEDRNSSTPHISSSIYTFNGDKEQFELLQEIPSHGAHGGDVFEGPDGHAYVFVANFGDRLGKEYDAVSTLWRQEKRSGLADTLGDIDSVRRSRFVKVAEVSTKGATDATAFVLKGRTFLAVANEGDVKNRADQVSAIYEVLLGGGTATDSNGGASDDDM